MAEKPSMSDGKDKNLKNRFSILNRIVSKVLKEKRIKLIRNRVQTIYLRKIISTRFIMKH